MSYPLVSSSSKLLRAASSSMRCSPLSVTVTAMLSLLLSPSVCLGQYASPAGGNINIKYPETPAPTPDVYQMYTLAPIAYNISAPITPQEVAEGYVYTSDGQINNTPGSLVTADNVQVINPEVIKTDVYGSSYEILYWGSNTG
jgi:hypothetical protein